MNLSVWEIFYHKVPFNMKRIESIERVLKDAAQCEGAAAQFRPWSAS